MAAQTKVRFLAEDIWQMPEDGNTYEVIDGELLVAPAPNLGHQLASSKLHLYLAQYVYGRGLGIVVAAPTGLVLDPETERPETGVQPDLIYVSNERAAIRTRRGIEGTPDLVVEILSPSTSVRDRGVKLRRYEAARIPHYWILDPIGHTVRGLRLGAGGFEEIALLGDGETFEPELFPGLKIPIADLWE